MAGTFDIARAEDNAVRRLVTVGVAVAALSVAITFVVGIVEGTVLPYDRLNPDSEASFFNWASSGAELIAAFVCALHAVVTPRSRRLFVALTVLILYVSVDDAFVIHETVSTHIQRRFDFAASIGQPIWTAAYAPLLLVTAGLLWLAVRGTRREAEALVLAGFACFATAITFEAMGATPLGEPLAVVISEEALELGGWELLATSLAVVLTTALVLYGTAWTEVRESDEARASRELDRDRARSAV